jgi:TetR/AcrR family transcriptional regulator, transcriptional repressor for nem operon
MGRSANQPSVEIDTAERILDVAERLVQTCGYNGFSYADVARELDVTKAALHYHFASKGELGVALLTRYTERFVRALDDADAKGLEAVAKLNAYGQLYLKVLQGGRMCLCGMLAAEHQTLPMPMQTALRRFFDLNERWLAKVLESGRNEGSLRFDGPAEQAARVIVSDLEGAMLIARLHDDVDRFTVKVAQLFDSLRSSARPKPRGRTSLDITPTVVGRRG